MRGRWRRRCKDGPACHRFWSDRDGAAIVAARAGLDVVVVDEQLTPGGQIWRNIEENAALGRAQTLGSAYSSGLAVVRAFRKWCAVFRPLARVWQIETSLRTYVTSGDLTETIEPQRVIVATGVQERAAPFAVWALPGAMTVGAAQSLLKDAGAIPQDAVRIAGTGPLALLYARQLIKVGGRVAAFLDMRGPLDVAAALRVGVPALPFGGRDIAMGLGWCAHVGQMLGDTIDFGYKASILFVTERLAAVFRPVVYAAKGGLSFKQSSQGTLVVGGGLQGQADLKSGVTHIDFQELAKGARSALELFPAIKTVQIVRAWTGIEGKTPDLLPVIGASARKRGVYHMFGFSGQGFEFVPIVGDIIAT